MTHCIQLLTYTKNSLLAYSSKARLVSCLSTVVSCSTMGTTVSYLVATRYVLGRPPCMHCLTVVWKRCYRDGALSNTVTFVSCIIRIPWIVFGMPCIHFSVLVILFNYQFWIRYKTIYLCLFASKHRYIVSIDFYSLFYSTFNFFNWMKWSSFSHTDCN